MDDPADARSLSPKRESHYNKQRSSLNSSVHSHSRPQSARHSSIGDAYSLTDGYSNLNEISAPPPIEPMPEVSESSLTETQRRLSSRGSRKDTQKRRSRRGSGHHVSSDQELPGSFENLTEVTYPSPEGHRHDSGGRYTRETLEDKHRFSRKSHKSKRASEHISPPRLSDESGGDNAPAPVIPLDRSGILGSSGSGNTPPEKASLPLSSLSTTQHVSKLATELYTVSYLILFSILGTLARLGLQWLTFYPGAPVEMGVLWANFGGSLIMGFMAEDRRLFQEEWGISSLQARPRRLLDEEEQTNEVKASKTAHAKVKKTIPLYIGIATGFCGSFTSFSSFMRDTFLALSNDLPTPLNHPYLNATEPLTSSTTPRNGGYSVMAILAVIILTLSLCISALKIGAHLAILLDPFTPALPFTLIRKGVDRSAVFLGWGAWLGAVFLAIWPPDRPSGPSSRGSWSNETWRGDAILACVFAPLGCLLRFYCSLKLNGVLPSFPVGTFAVNIFGTGVLGMSFVLQHVSIGSDIIGGSRVGCQVLQGIQDGFCGCLTTVSTWVLELTALRRRHAYTYGATSVLVGLGLLVMIMGSVRWTVGFSTPVCSV